MIPNLSICSDLPTVSVQFISEAYNLVFVLSDMCKDIF